MNESVNGAAKFRSKLNGETLGFASVRVNKMSNPNRVFIRSYCETDCDCPTCHDGEHTTEVEQCVYCQLKWAGKGEYAPQYRKKNDWAEPSELKVCSECHTPYMIKRDSYTGKETIEHISRVDSDGS